MNKIYLKKARQLRSNWRKRAKKANIELLHQVPDSKEICKFIVSLEKNGKFYCYLTNAELNFSDVEFDHKISVTRGGDFNLKNIGVTSRRLNNIKGEMSAKEFKQLLRLISKWDDGGSNLLHRLSRANNVFRR